MRTITFDELCSTITEYKNKAVGLTFHSIGDRDGVGSAVALSEYFTNAFVVTPDFLTNNAKKMLAFCGYKNNIEAKFPEGAEVIIILDANNLDVMGKFKERIKNFHGTVLFIDHHAPHNDLEGNVLAYNSEAYNSTASIICALLQKIQAGISKTMAFTLLNGIIADSADLNNSTSLTFRQIADLIDISKTEYSFISEYFHANIPVENRYQTVQNICSSTAEMVKDYVIMYGTSTGHANITADSAINLGADAAVYWLANEREASLSARLRSPLDKKLGIHLGIIMEGIAKTIEGTGGGHACAAGAYGRKRDAAQTAGLEVVRIIREAMKEPRHT